MVLNPQTLEQADTDDVEEKNSETSSSNKEIVEALHVLMRAVHRRADKIVLSSITLMKE